MTHQMPIRGPGRPKDQVKRAAIIAAATTLFLDRGYPGVTMEAVAATAGVSKMTVYGHFTDKATLFSAVVRSVCDQMVVELADLDEASGTRDLEAKLMSFGTALLGLILSPRKAVMHQALMGMLMKNPGLAKSFYEAGPGHMRSVLAVFLAAVAEREGLVFDSAEAAADDLISLWESDMPKRVALGLVPAVTPEAIDRRVRRGIRVFLQAYRRRGPGFVQTVPDGAYLPAADGI